MHRWSHVIAVVSFVVCAAAPAFAQSDRLAGHVADAQGAAIVRATVTLTSRAGTTTEVTTNPTGDFVFDRVAPGPYSVEVDAPGFVRWKQNVDVSIAPAPLNVVLRVAGVREAVDVVGTAGLTLTEAATTGSRLEIPALDTPASVFVMPGEAVRDRGAQTMNDAKSRITGVTIRANPGNGYNGLAARGFSDSGSVMQLFDGALMLVGASTVTFPFDPWNRRAHRVSGGTRVGPVRKRRDRRRAQRRAAAAVFVEGDGCPLRRGLLQHLARRGRHGRLHRRQDVVPPELQRQSIERMAEEHAV
jgi:hypothetical protein